MGIFSFLTGKKSTASAEKDNQLTDLLKKRSYNQLVLAGAGAGKTTSIIELIKEIIRTGRFRKEQILVLSYTNNSASELKERIKNETAAEIDVMTFHKLGKNIITESENITPGITDIKLSKHISAELSRLLSDSSYLRCISAYCIRSMVKAKSEFEFSSQKEYDDYLRKNPPVTFNHEKVKSYGEMEIANYLYINGINYKYEQAYEYDTRTREFGQYHPDFFLPDYNIYIEYFGIDSSGHPPSYFSGDYIASMKWKRELHAAKGTDMVESYAYEHFSGKLISELDKKLKSKGIVPEPEAPEKIWEKICGDEPDILIGLKKLFESVITLMKDRRYSIDDLKKLNKKRSGSSQTVLLLKLIDPIYESYCRALEEKNEIDFSDMINKAIDCIVSGKYRNKYRLVIVDEYQDISGSRAALLKALREVGDFELFCVGDDWQSIYRFAGSDISLTQNFSDYWGRASVKLLETSYRYPQRLAEIAGQFIMKNPEQIKKNMNGISNYDGCVIGEIQGYSEKKAVEFMGTRLSDLPENSSVFMIGRYESDKNILEKSDDLKLSYDNKKHEVRVHFKWRPDLNIRFLTAHKSKGLEADYVFIINNKQGRMGFPSHIQDEPVLNLLVDNSDSYPFAEERRLFYTAMTRARKKVILLTVKNHESEFIKELRKYCGDDILKEAFTCPLCGGKLSKKAGSHGDYMGCENFSSNGCKYIRKLITSKH